MHVHSNKGDIIKTRPNFATNVLMGYTLSKLSGDIQFDIFNMKFKNHLFYPCVALLCIYTIVIVLLLIYMWDFNSFMYVFSYE